MYIMYSTVNMYCDLFVRIMCTVISSSRRVGYEQLSHGLNNILFRLFVFTASMLISCSKFRR